ncbi:hypothetical protein Mapa_004032 [Marchantia paleacea]|nr:hypothetical protein Mapa_004032 [Marchantia paleacea]
MESFSFLSGPKTKTARAVRGIPAASCSSGSSIPNCTAKSLLGSEMMGYETLASGVKLSMSLIQALCDSTSLQLRASTFTPRFSNSGMNLPTAPSSVVQTGVKSLGCEKRIAHDPSMYLWKSISPCVVSATKEGARSPSFNAIFLS